MADELVKCADCGYLAVRLRDSREIVDAEDRLRSNGEMPADSRGKLYDEWPICFVRAWNLRNELQDNSGTPHIKAMVSEPRICKPFTAWQQGFTPKEHLEMNMLEEQRAALKLEAEDQKRFRDTEASRNHRWRMLELLVMGGIVTLVSVVAQVGSAFIERGSLFPASQPPPVGQVVMPPAAIPPDVDH